MKEDIKILLDRREEIVKEINKLQQEHTAIGNILTKVFDIEIENKHKEAVNRINKQIEEQSRNGRTNIMVDNSDLRELGQPAKLGGTSIMDMDKLKSILNEYER